MMGTNERASRVTCSITSRRLTRSDGVARNREIPAGRPVRVVAVHEQGLGRPLMGEPKVHRDVRGAAPEMRVGRHVLDRLPPVDHASVVAQAVEELLGERSGMITRLRRPGCACAATGDRTGAGYGGPARRLRVRGSSSVPASVSVTWSMLSACPRETTRLRMCSPAGR